MIKWFKNKYTPTNETQSTQSELLVEERDKEKRSLTKTEESLQPTPSLSLSFKTPHTSDKGTQTDISYPPHNNTIHEDSPIIDGCNTEQVDYSEPIAKEETSSSRKNTRKKIERQITISSQPPFSAEEVSSINNQNVEEEREEEKRGRKLKNGFNNLSFSLGGLRRLKTQKRVSIYESEEEESPWRIPPGFFKYHSQTEQYQSSLTILKSLGNPEDLELKAEIILGQKLQEKFHSFMLNKWVTTVDLGFREVNQQQTNLRCIKVWVKQKINEKEMSRSCYIEKMVDGCPVDKVVGNGHLLGGEENMMEYVLKRRRQRIYKSKAKESFSLMMIDPVTNVSPGDSIGQLKNQCIYGTAGLLLECHLNVGLLTAGHIGGRIGTKLVSPARREGKLTDTRIIAMTTISAITKEVNCVFARIDGHMTNNVNTNIKGSCTAKVGDIVEYTSSTDSNRQLARIKSIDWSGEMDGLQWSNQIQLSMPVLPGNGGAVLIKVDSREVVGMLIGNCDKHGIANHIEFILKALDATILHCQ